MKKWMLLLLSALLITLTAARVAAAPAAPEPQTEGAVYWQTVALFSLAGTGAGVVTARALYRKCQK